MKYLMILCQFCNNDEPIGFHTESELKTIEKDYSLDSRTYCFQFDNRCTSYHGVDRMV